MKCAALSARSIRPTLGRTLEQLKLLKEATEHFERAAEIFESLLGPEARQTLFARFRAINAHRNISRDFSPAAVPKLEAILATQRRLFGEGDPDSIETLRQIGWALFHHQTQRSRGIFRDLVSIYERTEGPNGPGTISALKGVASTTWNAGRIEEEIAVFHELVSRARQRYGNAHPASVDEVMKFCDWLEPRYPERAAKELEELRSLLRSELPYGHESQIAALTRLAGDYRRIGRSGDEMEVRQDLDAQLRAAATIDPLRIMENSELLGLLMQAASRAAEATPLLREAAAIRAEQQPDSPARFETMSRLGDALLAQGLADEAAPQLLAAFDGLVTLRLAGNEAVADALSAAGKALVRLPAEGGHAAKAAGLLSRTANGLARRCAFVEARDAFERLLEITPQDSNALHQYLPLVAYLGDAEVWAARCRESFPWRRQLHIYTEQAVKDAHLLPGLPIDTEEILATADESRAAGVFGKSIGWDDLALALCFYRAGRFQQCVRILDDLLREGRWPEIEKQGHAVLAMAEHQLGLGTRTTAERLARVEKERARHAPFKFGVNLGSSWPDVVTSELLLRESFEVLQTSPGKSPK